MARTRRRKSYFEEEEVNQERWLVSYADFITLLFAFFVVMYSISSINNQKYESLSEALDGAFSNSSRSRAKRPEKKVEVGQSPTTIQPIVLDNPSVSEINLQRQLSKEIIKEKRLLQQVTDEFQDVLQPYIKNDLIEVKRNDFWVELEMNSQLLFLSGEAELSRKAGPVLRKVSEVVKDLPNVISIEGHTDNVPIDTVEFPSNWDLSSARATSVVREFINYGIPPKRLSAVGYGEFHNVADNTTVDGRFKNRRVVLVIMSQAFARYGMSDKQRSEFLNIDMSENTVQNRNGQR